MGGRVRLEEQWWRSSPADQETPAQLQKRHKDLMDLGEVAGPWCPLGHFPADLNAFGSSPAVMSALMMDWRTKSQCRRLTPKSHGAGSAARESLDIREALSLDNRPIEPHPSFLIPAQACYAAQFVYAALALGEQMRTEESEDIAVAQVHRDGAGGSG